MAAILTVELQFIYTHYPKAISKCYFLVKNTILLTELWICEQIFTWSFIQTEECFEFVGSKVAEPEFEFCIITSILITGSQMTKNGTIRRGLHHGHVEGLLDEFRSVVVNVRYNNINR